MISVLIISSPHDTHGRCVARELDRLGVEACILDLSEFGRGGYVSHRVGASASGASIRKTDGTAIQLGKIDSIWYRRPAAPTIPGSVLNTNDRSFSVAEWREALDDVLFSLKARFVNPLAAQRSAIKPKQLRAARDVGLRVPDTLISNNPSEISDFIEVHGQRVIHKTLTAARHCFVGTERWREDARPIMLRDLPLAPVIFQEEIFGPADIRATVIGRRVFAARITRSVDRVLVDSRLEEDAPCEPCELPTTLQNQLVGLMDKLGLVFGTIDLRMTDGGEYVFFEINPQGQFLYIEILTGMQITSALAELLAFG